MYAITLTGYRAVNSGSELFDGETYSADIPPALLEAIKALEARTQRNGLLRSCDWTQATDSQLSVLEKTQWAAYRQALRDLPSLPGFPDVQWPISPTLPAGAAHSGG